MQFAACDGIFLAGPTRSGATQPPLESGCKQALRCDNSLAAASRRSRTPRVVPGSIAKTHRDYVQKLNLQSTSCAVLSATTQRILSATGAEQSGRLRPGSTPQDSGPPRVAHAGVAAGPRRRGAAERLVADRPAARRSCPAARAGGVRPALGQRRLRGVRRHGIESCTRVERGGGALPVVGCRRSPVAPVGSPGGGRERCGRFDFLIRKRAILRTVLGLRRLGFTRSECCQMKNLRRLRMDGIA